eukprot:TRINITY_DN4896_c0_g1_i3.p1 TRINITY_DN4896_c0_g1~~TRINITY_DN4896_c0_g1_i3.p1  ORF type:complete len:354 (+),score=61.07 TRINITY_DN4896_c0_g1_i3:38-1063(+)
MSNDTGLTDEHRIISVKGTYDEVHEVDGLEELPSSLAVTPQPISAGSQDLGFSPPPLKFARGDTPPKSPIMSNQDSYGDDTLMGDANEPLSDTGSLSDSTEDDLIETMEVEGAYDPAMYKNLNVKGDVEDLFKFITTYKPEIQELDTELKPFIPDYIPAVGDIDAFIKIPRPDGKPTSLGLNVVDEPCAGQSNPTVLDLHLRTIAKTTAAKTLKRNEVKNVADQPKAIDNWIESISQVHRDKQPQTVHYTSSMPDIDTLMQEWPEEVEQVLRSVQLPSASLDVDIKEYSDIVCTLFDIPSNKSRIQALHLLFTLFVEFRNSQHFGDQPDALAETGKDRLEL